MVLEMFSSPDTSFKRCIDMCAIWAMSSYLKEALHLLSISEWKDTGYCHSTMGSWQSRRKKGSQCGYVKFQPSHYGMTRLGTHGDYVCTWHEFWLLIMEWHNLGTNGSLPVYEKHVIQNILVFTHNKILIHMFVYLNNLALSSGFKSCIELIHCRCVKHIIA